MDADDNGNIDYNEFVAGALDANKIFTEENISKCFDFFDSDQSGYVSIEEFMDIFKLSDEDKFEEELSHLPEFQGGKEMNKADFQKLVYKLINYRG